MVSVKEKIAPRPTETTVNSTDKINGKEVPWSKIGPLAKGGDGASLPATDIVVLAEPKKPEKPVGGSTSDVTLKKNINYFGSGILNKIIALKPVRWNWKDKEEGTEIQYGFIAQDVEQVIPHLVSEGVWKDGSKRKLLKTTDMIPYLVSAIKEQQDQILALQKLVSKLQTKKKSSKSKVN